MHVYKNLASRPTGQGCIVGELMATCDNLTDLGFELTWNKNGGRGTKPTYIFLVIIPLLVIELKATANGNPSDDFLLEAEI